MHDGHVVLDGGNTSDADTNSDSHSDEESVNDNTQNVTNYNHGPSTYHGTVGWNNSYGSSIHRIHQFRSLVDMFSRVPDAAVVQDLLETGSAAPVQATMMQEEAAAAATRQPALGCVTVVRNATQTDERTQTVLEEIDQILARAKAVANGLEGAVPKMMSGLLGSSLQETTRAPTKATVFSKAAAAAPAKAPVKAPAKAPAKALAKAPTKAPAKAHGKAGRRAKPAAAVKMVPGKRKR